MAKLCRKLKFFLFYGTRRTFKLKKKSLIYTHINGDMQSLSDTSKTTKKIIKRPNKPPTFASQSDTKFKLIQGKAD